VEGAPIACVGAGTGLGECFSTCAEPGAPYETFPSEGGHAEFAPRNDLEMELLTFLKAKFKQKNRVSVERVISGPGLANVYEFLTTKFPRQVSKEVQAEFVAAGDMQGRVVAQHAGKGAGSKAPHCTLCEQALDIMLGAYGSECGVACLKWIPLRGMYVAGGLTPKNISRLTEPNSPFMAAFHDKGRLSPLLKRVPLYAVMVEDIGQRGAHLVAYKQLRSLRESTRKQANILAKWQKAAVGTGMVDDLTSTQIYAALAAICAGGFAAGALFARRRL
jgi:glucokinase